MRISSVSQGSQLTIEWQDGSQSGYGFFWLRDHARDELNFDARSHQRKLFTAELDPNVAPSQTRVIEDGAAIEVNWPDQDRPVRYSCEFLFQFRSETPASSGAGERVLWKGDLSIPEVDYRVIAEQPSPEETSPLLNALFTYGFVLVQNCPVSGDDEIVSNLTGSVGYVRNSLFGGIWTFEADAAMDDSAYSAETLRPHTDGTYSLDPPGVQILLCLLRDTDSIGGESIMVDGFRIAAELAQSDPELFSDLAEIPITGIYRGDGAVLKAQHPIFRQVNGQLRQVCFNNYDRDAMRLDDDTMDRLYEGIRKVDSALNDETNQWRHTLEPGQALIFDNWRVLHGRTAYSGRRKMTGAYSNHEDLESRFRQAGLAE